MLHLNDILFNFHQVAIVLPEKSLFFMQKFLNTD